MHPLYAPYVSLIYFLYVPYIETLTHAIQGQKIFLGIFSIEEDESTFWSCSSYAYVTCMKVCDTFVSGYLIDPVKKRKKKKDS